MRLSFFVFLGLLFSCRAGAQLMDVQHYRYEIALSDASDSISGSATIRLRFLNDTDTFQLHLSSVRPGGKGMAVKGVYRQDRPLAATHAQQRLHIRLDTPARKGTVHTFRIVYAGIPEDGLIISRNKYGDRTFFADNWPDRARHWIPCHDVPADKASVEFVVTAPLHYAVVSNGLQVEETILDKGSKRTHWSEPTPIPTKVMVIGAARFAVARYSDSTGCVPVSAWVYPQDREKGFYDYALATGILQFFTAYIGPYPFAKLANVQSKTIFGGMENASAIFYTESSVTGNRGAEGLMAHEIAHQWFGNMATEKSFAHLWLSEGFATYLTDVYLEKKYGRDTLVKRLQEERREVADFARESRLPVVDSVSPLMDLLNANSYQKGAWVLHMLRQTTGDSIFQHIVRSYYRQYKGGNADTKDFQQVAEGVWGKKLDTFFAQWLHTPGIPQVRVKWRHAGQLLTLSVEQGSGRPFVFPLEVALVDGKNNRVRHRLSITRAAQTFTLPAAHRPVQVLLDPDTQLLFEGQVIRER